MNPSPFPLPLGGEDFRHGGLAEADRASGSMPWRHAVDPPRREGEWEVTEDVYSTK